MRSSMLSNRCFSLFTAWFALHISTQILTSFESFGTTTIRLTHGVAPATFSIISNCSNRSSFFSTSFRTWKGFIRWGCCFGFTWGSICKSASPFTFPIPPNKELYSCSTHLGYKGSTVYTDIWRRLNCLAVAKLSRFPKFPWTTCSLAIVDTSDVLTS